MEVRETVRIELLRRLQMAQGIINNANDTLKSEDFLQTAVRLQELKTVGNFTELELNIMDSI